MSHLSKAQIDANWGFFEKLPSEEEARAYITYNDLEILDAIDPASIDDHPILVRFCLQEMGCDITDHPDEHMHDQIMVAICRWIDEDPSRWDIVWKYATKDKSWQERLGL